MQEVYIWKLRTRGTALAAIARQWFDNPQERAVHRRGDRDERKDIPPSWMIWKMLVAAGGMRRGSDRND